MFPFLVRNRQNELVRKDFKIHKLEREEEEPRLEDDQKVLSKEQFEQPEKERKEPERSEQELEAVDTKEGEPAISIEVDEEHSGIPNDDKPHKLDIWI